MLEKTNNITTTAISSTSTYHMIMSKLIEDCKNEQNKDTKVAILNQINSKLLEPDRINMSEIRGTDDYDDYYIEMTLHRIEGKILLH
jgi:hypothetical protein